MKQNNTEGSRLRVVFSIVVFLVSVHLVGCRLEVSLAQEEQISPIEKVESGQSLSVSPTQVSTPRISNFSPELAYRQSKLALPEKTAEAAASVVESTVVIPTNTPTPIPVAPAVSAPNHILAPAIGLEGDVVTATWKILEDSNPQTSVWVVPDNAAGWHINSGLPGHGTNIVISGHHNTGTEIFRNLINLQLDDQIILEADGRPYFYVVTDRFILPERNISDEQRKQNAQWIKPTANERITLITCWPYNDNSHRLLIIAKPSQPSL
jgi:LPXTG-site transpeptidase (sortase) family protein